MIRVSATKLRNNLFDYLDKAAAGETIIIQRNNQEVARLVAIKPGDWREKIKLTPKLLVAPEELIKPLDDIWADYI
jgi:prevent-host-death family protein